jgi:hypothetical protein
MDEKKLKLYYEEQAKILKDLRKSGISIKTDIPLKPIQTEVVSDSKKRINCKMKKDISIDW